MSADLTIRKNGFVEHAYRGQAGWTGLGNVIEHGDDLDTIIRKGGLDWEVVRSRCRYIDEAGTLHTLDDKIVTFRSDNKAALGVVSNNYQVVQPRQVAEFFRDLLAGSGLEIETLGTLQGGKRVWCMAKCDVAKQVVKGDYVAPYVLVSTSMDGTMATTVRFTTVRVVCHNTLRMAMGASKGGIVTVRHSSVFDIKRAQEEMATYHDCFNQWMVAAQTLQAKNVSEDYARALLADLFGKKAKVPESAPVLVTKDNAMVLPQTDFQALLGQSAKIAENVKISKAEADILGLFQGNAIGNDIKGVAGTGWGLLNAITQYVDHGTANSRMSQENRLQSAWFGQGDDIKVSAFQQLLAA
jgi:phage/plasmid-like protein (TIGR03299 family)